MEQDTVLKEKRKRWHESLAKDVYIEEALNVLNLPKFINTFCEHTINNAKKPTAKKSVK